MDTTDGTAAVSWGTDRIDLFWADADRALIHRAWRDGAWDDPESLGGTLASPASATAWSRRPAPGLCGLRRR